MGRAATTASGQRIFTNGRIAGPQICPFPWGIRASAPLNTLFLGATWVHTPHDIVFSIAGSICKNRALCDNFFKLCVVLGMDITFSKTTAHKLGRPHGGRYAKKSKMAATGNWKGHISAPISLTTLCNTSLPMFFGLRNTFLKSFLSFNYIFRVFLSFDMVIFLWWM